MEKTFLFLQELLKETAGIPLSRIDRRQSALPDFLRQQTNGIFDFYFQETDSFWKKLLQLTPAENAIYQWTAPGGITVLLYADSPGEAVYALGPVLTHPFSQEYALRMLEQYSLPAQKESEILTFCSRLKAVQPHILHRTADLVIGYLTGTQKSLPITAVNLPAPDWQPFRDPLLPEEDIVHMRQVETRYEYSAALTDAVRQGNLSLALHLVGSYDPGSQTPVRNTNPLRNAQNYCIVMNTQLRHALERTGIHPFSVDRLSNAIGLEIEQLKSTKQLPEFFRSVLQRYCRLVQEHNYPNLKPLTHLTIAYIKEHLADNLTVKDTAKALTVNANYLSGLFHRDMGVTFIDFVNKERARQAAALLRHTNLQVQQIASAVGYNNTSYFAKQFLRFYGVTPSHYRRG